MQKILELPEAGDRLPIRMNYREDWYKLISTLMSSIASSSYQFFLQRGIQPVLMPITTGSVSSPMGLGSDSLPVRVHLMGEKTYLADSMQFHLEYMLRLEHRGVWYLMPTFRGEDPDERHLNQFFHVESEIQGDFSAILELVESYVFFITKEVASQASKEIEAITNKIDHLTHFLSLSSIPKISFSEVKKEFKNDKRFFVDQGKGIHSISAEGEQALLALFKSPVWITHPHKLSVPFYQASQEGEALSADLLMGIGEVAGCGQRHTSYEETLRSLQAHQVDAADYTWYLKLKQQAPMLTAGFGLGIERYLLWILQHDDIRDIPIFQRLKGKPCQP